ncbi:MAG: oxidoreductase, partial [Flavobacteriaceae bacterium]|nr:oxidoreductase [Flavobacteriaceae bacterium]
HFKKKELPLFVAYYRRTLPRFKKIKIWLDNGDIGEPRHISWVYSCPASEQDLSKEYNWRTDANIATGGYFDDLASHGLDLFIYLFGNVKQAKGISANQQKLYTAKDIISASWEHENGVLGTGMWSFGAYKREDAVRVIGSEGELSFSVFSDDPIELITEEKIEQMVIENPKNIQQFHVENMAKHLQSNFQHPSTGKTAMHTAWVMDSILDKL